MVKGDLPPYAIPIEDGGNGRGTKEVDRFVVKDGGNGMVGKDDGDRKVSRTTVGKKALMTTERRSDRFSTKTVMKTVMSCSFSTKTLCPLFMTFMGVLLSIGSTMPIFLSMPFGAEAFVFEKDDLDVSLATSGEGSDDFTKMVPSSSNYVLPSTNPNTGTLTSIPSRSSFLLTVINRAII